MSRIESRENFCKCCGNSMDAIRCVRGTVCGKCKAEGHTYFDCVKCRQALEEEMRGEEKPLIVVVGNDDAGREALLAVIRSGFAGIEYGTGMIVDRREFPDAFPIPQNELLNIPEPNLEGVKKFKEILCEAFKGDRETRRRRRIERDQASRPQAYPKTKLIKDGRYKWKIKK